MSSRQTISTFNQRQVGTGDAQCLCKLRSSVYVYLLVVYEITVSYSLYYQQARLQSSLHLYRIILQVLCLFDLFTSL